MKRMDSLSVVNIVGSGKLNIELELSAVAEDLQNFDQIETAEHSRNQGNRILVRFVSTDYLGIVAPTGVYVFTGGDTEEGLYESKQTLLHLFSEMSIIPSEELAQGEIVDEFEIKNLVVTADLEKELNLDSLAIGIGLEQTEYEPEQFPGLIYRSDHSTMLIFATGKIVITGIKLKETASSEFDKLRAKLKGFI